MTREERYEYILEWFGREQPEADSELRFGSVFQLLVAVVLSAQCTDKRVNMITPTLFAHYPDAASMASAGEGDVLALIRSVSYPNAKARHVVALSRMLVADFGGEVPQTMEALTRLPGVGRKTANVVLAVAFGQSAMPVDTHVFRVSHRLGLVPRSATTPQRVEAYLVRHIPAALMGRAHHWLLLHGRYICQSRKPKCSQCQFAEICPSAASDEPPADKA